MPTQLKKVLLIEDDPDDQAMIRAVLEAKHIECETAETAMEGLEKAAALQPNLILLDLMLPKVSGFGFIRELKKNPATAQTPVVVLTSLRDQEIAAASIDMGASSFLAKECINRDLIAMIYEYAR